MPMQTTIMQYNVIYKASYKKSLKKLGKQKKNLKQLTYLIEELQVKDFTHAYKNHKLEPKSKNIWECHVGSVASDWVLVYTYKDDALELILINTGSHSEVLNSSYEITNNYEKLVQAAAKKDFDYVLNIFPNGRRIPLPEKVWDKVYDLLFDTDKEAVMTIEEYKKERKLEDAYGNIYSAI